MKKKYFTLWEQLSKEQKIIIKNEQEIYSYTWKSIIKKLKEAYIPMDLPLGDSMTIYRLLNNDNTMYVDFNLQSFFDIFKKPIINND